jgi:hypothetical protein
MRPLRSPPPLRDCRFSPKRGFDKLSLSGWGVVFKGLFPLTLSSSKGLFAFIDSLLHGGGDQSSSLRNAAYRMGPLRTQMKGSLEYGAREPSVDLGYLVNLK